MESKLTVRFFVRQTSPTSSKLTIYVRITLNRLKKDIATSHRIEAGEWNEESQQVKRGRKSYINEDLSAIKEKIYKIKRDFEHRGSVVTAEALKNEFMGKNIRIRTLVGYIEDFLKFKKNNPEISSSTLKSYKITFLHLFRYLESENKKNIHLQEVDFRFIEGFDAYLMNHIGRGTKQTLSRNYANKRHSQVRTVLHRAVREGLLSQNPYQYFQLKEAEVQRSVLSFEELSRIEQADFGGNVSLQRVRDMFLFACYCGLRFSDALKCSSEQIQLVNGKKYLLLVQQKTKKEVKIPVLSDLNTLLNRLSGSKDYETTGFFLPQITNKQTNFQLKSIADYCEIGKKLTFHVARRTFATTILSKNGISIEKISHLLGHSDTKVTQLYALVDEEGLSEIADEVEAKLRIRRQSQGTK